MPNSVEAHIIAKRLIGGVESNFELDDIKSPSTPEIAEAVNLAAMRVRKNHADDVVEAAVAIARSELIKRFSISQGAPTILTSNDDTDHVPWLPARNTTGWDRWARYEKMLLETFPRDVVAALDRSTDAALGQLEDPTRPGSWDRRGMVIGNVQSGKTSHYTGLLCKAADAGYQVIVVLAGAHNNLRSQTQIRLEEGFIGRVLDKKNETKEVTGVGRYTMFDAEGLTPHCFTSRSEDGDFRTSKTKTSPTFESKPWVFIVKKNGTVLNELIRFLLRHLVTTSEGPKQVTGQTLLVIDDECDYASVDTRDHDWDPDSGEWDDVNPTRINGLIRRLLNSFQRAAYVAYTATPFANIFIHDDITSASHGEDLFPKSFILNLRPASNYIGADYLFGGSEDSEYPSSNSLIRTIGDESTNDVRASGWLPLGHKKQHIPLYEGEDAIPPSLEEAILAFFLSCAVRAARGQGNQHMSMLIHVTRFVDVQKWIHRQVADFVGHVRTSLTYDQDRSEYWARMRDLYETQFHRCHRDTVTYEQSLGRRATDLEWVPWADLRSHISQQISEIETYSINGLSDDSLRYDLHKDTGLKSITIGGDKLSRGLTLEGLSVSYFMRPSKTIDTLMQMGRWFGYRDGYLDVCRLYISDDIYLDFEALTVAAEDLRDQIDMLAQGGRPPKEFGLGVPKPENLLPTARNKMRSALLVTEELEKTTYETTTFYNNGALLQENLDSFKSFVQRLGHPIPDFQAPWKTDSNAKWNGLVWQDVPFEYVTDFLRSFQTTSSVISVDANLLVRHLEKTARRGEATHWTIAVAGSSAPDVVPVSMNDGSSLNLPVVRRSVKREHVNDFGGTFSIKRIASPIDESIDLTRDQFEHAVKLTAEARSLRYGTTVDVELEKMQSPRRPAGNFVRSVRGFGGEQVPDSKNRGLLVLYLAQPKPSADPENPDSKPALPPNLRIGTDTVFPGFLISLPATSHVKSAERYINAVAQRTEYDA